MPRGGYPGAAASAALPWAVMMLPLWGAGRTFRRNVPTAPGSNRELDAALPASSPGAFSLYLISPFRAALANSPEGVSW